MIALLSMETGISPQDLLAAPTSVLDEMLAVMAERAEEATRADLRARLESGT